MLDDTLRRRAHAVRRLVYGMHRRDACCLGQCNERIDRHEAFDDPRTVLRILGGDRDARHSADSGAHRVKAGPPIHDDVDHHSIGAVAEDIVAAVDQHLLRNELLLHARSARATCDQVIEPGTQIRGNRTGQYRACGQ
jgi:hypothetical protein